MAIRAVNSLGTATQNIMVEGVNIGNAAAGYTQLDDALDAAANGDTIAITEAFEENHVYSGVHYTQTDLLIVVADNALGTFDKYDGSGYRLTGDSLLLWLEGSGTIIRGVKFKNITSNTNSAVALVPSAGTITLDRCFIQYNANSIGACLALAGAGSVELWNNVFYKSNGSGVAAVQDFGIGTAANLRNCLAYASVNVGCYEGANATKFKAQNCIAIAGGTGTCFVTTGAIGNGNNSSTDSTAPGTTTYQNAAGVQTTDLVSVSAGSENFNWVDYNTMIDFDGIDLSGTFTKDIAAITRTTWYIGSHFRAPTFGSMNPTNGTAAGGTTVTITGTIFTGATSVTFDGLAATDLIVSNDTTLSCVTPAHAAGGVAVLIVTPAGTVAAQEYTYDAAPASGGGMTEILRNASMVGSLSGKP